MTMPKIDKTYNILFIYVLIIFISACQSSPTVNPRERKAIQYSEKLPVIDGIIDAEWEKVAWNPIDQYWVGKKPSKNDFQGQYKVMWNEEGLFVLAKITDDILVDNNRNPLKRYWDDDCLEIFVDEDGSRGNHQFNHNAFAYHIALDQKIVDIGTDSKPHLYPNNVNSTMVELGNNEYLWEVRLNMYKDTYRDGMTNAPIKLTANQDFGFAIAYCDNDTSEERENFIGSSVVEGEDKNRGWIDAGVFGRYTLVK